MIRLAASLSLIMAALASPALAQSGEPQPSDTISTAVLVELSEHARQIGYPAVCPGSSPDEDQSEMLCFAELYEVRARVIRNLGGAELPYRVTIRFTAHSFHAVWRKQRRMLLIVAPFDDKGRKGHFAHYWDWQDESGRFCQAATDIARWQDSPIKRLYLSVPGRPVLKDSKDWTKGMILHCVTGTEPLRDR